MAGLVSAQSASSAACQNIDARREAGHDVETAQILGLHRPYFDDVRNEVPKQILNTVLESCC